MSMGDFSISCGMSGLSMINTDVVLFPIKPNPYEGKDGRFEFNQHSIVSNEGATALFEPWALPIFGHLRDYGVLDEVEEDYNTKSLENYFDGAGIIEIAEEVCYPSNNLTKFPKYHTGMIVHRKVWDKFSQPGFDEFGKQIELKDYKGISRRETWDDTIRKWKERRQLDLQSVKHFEEKGDIEAVKLFSRVSYFDLQYILSFGAKRDVEAVLDIYSDAIDNEEFYNRMTALHCFRWNMMACNRLFMPTFNGYQYGNFYMACELAQLTSQLAQEKIDEYEENNNED
jgi:hypothetical protein